MVATGSHGNEVWSRRLKAARLAAGLSQKELGVLAELDEFVASTRINRYELGVHKADYQISVKLAGVLGIPVAYLYCDDDVLAEALLLLGRLSSSKLRRAIKSLKGTFGEEAIPRDD
jgi:transcriptional regulator with XRE-family HTH domain